MDDDDFVPISALQHYLYCPRQCALIHVEQVWAESVHTAQGRVLHERADRPRSAKRRGVRTVTAMPLAHAELRIRGIADVVEFHATAQGERAVPVEYKRGRPKTHRADEVQLCAQALCLEAMLGHTIPLGDLFYGETHRRVEVAFDDELRQLTYGTVTAVREMIAARLTPKAVYQARKCDACSLIDLCQPRVVGRHRCVSTWLAQQLHEA
ncbi:CRISPR-associated protein Cas4 [Ramlibacter tataouinensis]|uniref:CRISPR-associated exonuclease Cas4 n=1 Tax=Ramlibacter tataouinensis (strain ATCC BAA-407 / DSM 14655 / LMG 21543 / TTB310) TaxID=365046 RepID=F5Y037_RAMTT|nr:CRISPR-associated protein Cas4 [Ramlibacter tataouinensis]AEG94586.1 Conserved hypothetical protein [Ramlibacter tataouinensis TTB310]